MSMTQNSIDLAHVAAAVGGGTAAAFMLPPGTSTLERVGACVVGTLCAVFLGPVIAPFATAGLEALDMAVFGNVMHVSESKVLSACGFLTGLLGMAITRSLHRLLAKGEKRAGKIIDGGSA